MARYWEYASPPTLPMAMVVLRDGNAPEGARNAAAAVLRQRLVRLAANEFVNLAPRPDDAVQELIIALCQRFPRTAHQLIDAAMADGDSADLAALATEAFLHGMTPEEVCRGLELPSEALPVLHDIAGKILSREDAGTVSYLKTSLKRRLLAQNAAPPNPHPPAQHDPRAVHWLHTEIYPEAERTCRRDAVRNFEEWYEELLLVARDEILVSDIVEQEMRVDPGEPWQGEEYERERRRRMHRRHVEYGRVRRRLKAALKALREAHAARDILTEEVCDAIRQLIDSLRPGGGGPR